MEQWSWVSESFRISNWTAHITLQTAAINERRAEREKEVRKKLKLWGVLQRETHAEMFVVRARILLFIIHWVFRTIEFKVIWKFSHFIAAETARMSQMRFEIVHSEMRNVEKTDRRRRIRLAETAKSTSLLTWKFKINSRSFVNWNFHKEFVEFLPEHINNSRNCKNRSWKLFPRLMVEFKIRKLFDSWNARWITVSGGFWTCRHVHQHFIRFCQRNPEQIRD